ncbi:MAG: hypothetical protein ACRCZ2_09040 [Fusobacteriaceae bacterium]
MTAPVIEDGALQCPRCGEVGGLHHGVVTVQSRDAEDGYGTEVVVEGARVSVERTDAEHYGTRRDALRVGFWCEHCDADGDAGPCVDLVLRQHKGLTLVAWERSR